MFLYPAVQQKAQAEIDRVVGPHRPPTMDDEHSLQYIRAIVKETLRWMPTTILGAAPHAVTQDDRYAGSASPPARPSSTTCGVSTWTRRGSRTRAGLTPSGMP